MTPTTRGKGTLQILEILRRQGMPKGAGELPGEPDGGLLGEYQDGEEEEGVLPDGSVDATISLQNPELRLQQKKRKARGPGPV